MGQFQQRASFQHKEAWVGGEFGEAFARRKFGDDIVNALPVKKRGKYKGRFNATIAWVKVTVPGWVPMGRKLYNDENHPGYVERRQDKIVAVILYSDTSYGGFVIHAIEGDTWHFADELRAANTNQKAA